LIGGGGQDTLLGDGGDDTAVYAHDFANYWFFDMGQQIVVLGAESGDTLRSVEHLQFADGKVDVADGNPLFDTLYYMSHNLDVYDAKANALQHFDQTGWHEGRDPNPYFSVDGYLATNPDVKASGQNPLDHYHQSGWHEGRDPSSD